MGDINDRDDIEALKNEIKENLTDDQIEALRKEVEKIIRRNEVEERRKKFEEMERLYGLNIYA